MHKIGNYSAVAAAAVPLGAILFKLLSKRSTQLQFTVLFMLLGTGLVGIGLSRDLITVVGFAFIQQTGAGMCIPVLIGWSLREMPEQFRGRGMGLWTSAFFLGQFLSPFLVTLVHAAWTGGLLADLRGLRACAVRRHRTWRINWCSAATRRATPVTAWPAALNAP